MSKDPDTDTLANRIDRLYELTSSVEAHRDRILVVGTDLGRTRMARAPAGAASAKYRARIGEVTTFEALAAADLERVMDLW